MVDPTFDRTLAVLAALIPLLIAVVGAVVAIVTGVLKYREAKLKGPQQPAAPAAGVTAPAQPGDDNHADDAIEALTESRDAWKARALDAEPRLRRANSTLAEHGLPTA